MASRLLGSAGVRAIKAKNLAPKTRKNYSTLQTAFEEFVKSMKAELVVDDNINYADPEIIFAFQEFVLSKFVGGTQYGTAKVPPSSPCPPSQPRPHSDQPRSSPLRIMPFSTSFTLYCI